MFRPVLQVLGRTMMALSIAALSSAAPAVYGRGGLIQAIFPFVAGLGLLAGGVRCNRLGGGTDFVGVRPEAFASDFHIAMGYGRRPTGPRRAVCRPHAARSRHRAAVRSG